MNQAPRPISASKKSEPAPSPADAKADERIRKLAEEGDRLETAIRKEAEQARSTKVGRFLGIVAG